MVFVSPAEGRVTSWWGERKPLPYHYGIDIAPPIPGTRGWPVYAAYGGRVVAVNDGSSRNWITGSWNTGSYVKVDGPGGGSEWYGHLETFDVKLWDTVKAGDRLGTMGDRGNVTGIHLHFETWDRYTRSPHDPMIDFREHGVKPGSKPKRKVEDTMAKLDSEDYDNIARAVWGYRNSKMSKFDAWSIHLRGTNRIEQVLSAIRAFVGIEK